jgi:hypothetical protein
LLGINLVRGNNLVSKVPSVLELYIYTIIDTLRLCRLDNQLFRTSSFWSKKQKNQTFVGGFLWFCGFFCLRFCTFASHQQVSSYISILLFTQYDLASGETIGHEDSVCLSVCKVHISANRWRIYTSSAVALQKPRGTAKILNVLL